jgi:hypothetical protein
MTKICFAEFAPCSEDPADVSTVPPPRFTAPDSWAWAKPPKKKHHGHRSGIITFLIYCGFRNFKKSCMLKRLCVGEGF